MDVPIAEMAEAVRDIARWERHRIEITHWQALRGQCEPPPDIAFAGWRGRLEGLEAAGRLLTILASHEAAVRELHEALQPATAREEH